MPHEFATEERDTRRKKKDTRRTPRFEEEEEPVDNKIVFFLKAFAIERERERGDAETLLSSTEDTTRATRRAGREDNGRSVALFAEEGKEQRRDERKGGRST